MRIVLRPHLLILLVCLAAPLAHGQHSEDWQPVTRQDLEFKDVPEDPGAAAVQLYYADFRDDIRQYRFIYSRVKVLTDKGRSYADVEIPVPSEYLMESLQARTIHPDGSVVEFAGKPFEKVIVRKREEKHIAKVITLPNVTVGSIIEYKYRLSWKNIFDDTTWTVQHNLYTVKENFWLRPFQGEMSTKHTGDAPQLSYVYSNMPPGVTPHDTKGGIELNVENVPAFKLEPWMPPESTFKWEVRFFYGGREIVSPETFWRDAGKDSYEKAERFIGNHNALKRAAAALVAAEPTPETQLKKLYARAQQIRNLSYERVRSRVEDRKEDLKPNENVMDVWNHGYGSRDEIAELFTALARAVGFKAELLRVSSRANRLFDMKLLSEKQLESKIVRVNLNSSDLFLDPGTRFCPFGLVAWPYTSELALYLAGDKSNLIVVPTATADKSIVRRTAKMLLDREGTLRGEVVVEFKGNEALRHRLNAMETDGAGRNGELEDELRDWLPPSATVHFKDAAGWDYGEKPLVARFTVEAPGYAFVAGKRLLLPANLFRSKQSEAFTIEERKYPVYLPYTYEEIDSVSIELQEGYSVNELPNGQDVKLASTRFITTRSIQEGRLLLTRALVVNSIYFPPDQYPQLKGFFNKLQSADEEQLVVEEKPASKR